ncbi:MAG TPA: type II toxin-antitoxin system death-on-curing family toxin [Longimicrobiales bacterium]|nr:type II toxin-antitoxin system death-on-curing family toxin [Longimicrobiales bacterium]
MLAIHADQLREHGGLPGVRDSNALDSALNRAPMQFHYKPDSDLFTLAAAYGFGVATSHPFTDGNKRTAFLCMYVFLGLNGHRIITSEPEVVALMLDVAAGTIAEGTLADWLRTHAEPRQRMPCA